MSNNVYRKRHLSIFVALGALTLAWSGCGAGEDLSPGPQLQARSLYNFDSCEQLRNYSQAQLLDMLDKSWENSGGVWGAAADNDSAESGAAGKASQESAAPESSQGPATKESGGDGSAAVPDHSKTNVQVEGVDEPDIVKTDGRRIIAVTRGELIVVDVSGMVPVITDRLDLEGHKYGRYGQSGEMFLHGNKVLLIDPSRRDDVPASAWPEAWKGKAGHQNVVRIQEFDLSTPGQARLLRKLHVDGHYVSARKIGGVARLVLQKSVQLDGLKSPYEFMPQNGSGAAVKEPDQGPTGPSNPSQATGVADTAEAMPGDSTAAESGQNVQNGRVERAFRQGDVWKQQWEEAKKKARQYNEGIIARIQERDILPSFVREDLSTGVSQVQNGYLYNCEQSMRPGVRSGVEMLSVLTLDLDAGIAPGASMGIMAAGQTVYSSDRGLYVATQPWQSFGGPGMWSGGAVTDDAVDQDGVNPAIGARAEAVSEKLQFRQQEKPKDTGVTTYIHKFDVSDPKTARYVASGSIDGRLLNQFAMSELNGDLRVAATRHENWRPKDSFVAVMRPEGDLLKELSRVGELGKTETIRSVRFMGDIGYVVTFRQTDPLYTINLKDPMKPTVMGELKIEGYSSYLHPMAPGYLLGVGRDATPEGRDRGLQVSIFDVRNLAAPTRIHNFTLAGAQSKANWDHRAFLYWPKTQTAVIPVQRWWWEQPEAGSTSKKPKVNKSFIGGLVLGVDAATGIKERSRIEHEGIHYKQYPKEKAESFPEASKLPKQKAPLERSVVIGDVLYTMSWAGLKANSLVDGSEISWTKFSTLK